MYVDFDSTQQPVFDPARAGAPDLYQGVHKGIRNALHANLLRLGQLDVHDPAEIAAASAELEDLLDWLQDHLRIEETFLHAAIEQRSPQQLPSQARQDHEHHRRDLVVLLNDCSALRDSATLPVAARQALARRLHLSFARFVGENLVHMTLEETQMNPMLWALFSDEELHGIHARIMASEAPKQLARATRWMLPALNPDERSAIVIEARAAIDPAIFGVLLAQMKTLLSARDVEKLEAALARSDAGVTEGSPEAQTV